MRPTLAEALRIRGLLHLRQARWPEAQAALEEALTLYRAMPAPYSEAKVLYFYGLLHRARASQNWPACGWRRRWPSCTGSASASTPSTSSRLSLRARPREFRWPADCQVE
jgi:hypothetical protein